MENFILPLSGGLLIGVAATLYLLTTGKVVGISGIFAQALFNKERGLPILFIIGLILGGSTYGNLIPQHAEIGRASCRERVFSSV